MRVLFINPAPSHLLVLSMALLLTSLFMSASAFRPLSGRVLVGRRIGQNLGGAKPTLGSVAQEVSGQHYREMNQKLLTQSVTRSPPTINSPTSPQTQRRHPPPRPPSHQTTLPTPRPNPNPPVRNGEDEAKRAAKRRVRRQN